MGLGILDSDRTNLAIPLTALWSRKLRVNVTYLFILSFIIHTGMWFERFVIVLTSCIAITCRRAGEPTARPKWTT